jgi:hypothetical protein
MAYLMIQNAKRQRRQAQQKANNDANFVRDVLRRFDVSKTRTLRFEEVRAWLKFLADSQSNSVNPDQAQMEMMRAFPGASAGLSYFDQDADTVPDVKSPDGECEVTDDEVQWIFMMVMDKKEEGSYQRFIEDNGEDALQKLELPPADFERALMAWRSYVHNKPIIEQVHPTVSLNKTRGLPVLCPSCAVSFRISSVNLRHAGISVLTRGCAPEARREAAIGRI